MRIIAVLISFAFLYVARSTSEKCTTPNNEEAECVSLYSCPTLVNAIATQQKSSIEFVQKSNCGGSGTNPMVCCGSTSTFKPEASETNISKSNSMKLLPSRKYCGYQHSDDYYRTENDTAISEFPWLANLLFRADTKTGTICGATLISSRYVLTTGSCASSTGYYSIAAVRLGEYNVKNKTDCIGEDVSPDLYECSEPPQEFDVENITIHPKYNPRHPYSNNIALIRLNRTVMYSDYIRPVCLPRHGAMLAKPGDTVMTTGWGTNHATILNPTETKKKILLKVITNEECAAVSDEYQELVTENQFCTTSIYNSTEIACAGDGGGPVMFSFRNQWQIEGVFSVGKADCTFGKPDVHTKVVNYLNWIAENILP